jgi:hypothetical protein
MVLLPRHFLGRVMRRVSTRRAYVEDIQGFLDIVTIVTKFCLAVLISYVILFSRTAVEAHRKNASGADLIFVLQSALWRRVIR